MVVLIRQSRALKLWSSTEDEIELANKLACNSVGIYLLKLNSRHISHLLFATLLLRRALICCEVVTVTEKNLSNLRGESQQRIIISVKQTAVTAFDLYLQWLK